MKSSICSVAGFPSSVISILIKELKEIAEKLVTEEAWHPSSMEDHHERNGLKRLLDDYKPSVELLLKVVPVDDKDPVWFVTRHMNAFKDFLDEVSSHLSSLPTPSE